MTLRRYLMTCLVLAGSPALAAPKEPPIPPPPPMAQRLNVSIFRGRSVEIPLRALGRSPSQLKFYIRKKPEHGRLGEIRLTGQKSAVVTYTHDEAQGEGFDSFTFAVQSVDSPVSAAAPINITISEEPPALAVVHEVNFGRLWIGEDREEEITIRNAGGGWLAGRVTAPAPWKILGSADYRLGRKEEQRIRLLFAPEEEREYAEKLVFSHDARSSIDLRGEAVSPFVFEPSREIELKSTDTGSMRSGAVQVTNRTPRERTMEITVPPEITAPTEVTIPPGGKELIPLHTQEDFLGDLEGKITLESEGFSTSLALRVFALLPQLKVEPQEGLNFGKVEPRRRYKGSISITNQGGTRARLQVSAPPEILLLPDPNTAALAPGQTRVFEVAFEPPNIDEFSGQIEISAEAGAPISLPVLASISKPEAAAQKIPTTVLAPVISDPSKDLTETREPYSGIPPIKEIRVLKASKRDLEIGWRKPAPNTVAYVVEQRMLEMNKKGPPKIRWQEIRRVKFLEEGNMSIARFENMAPGQVWFLRISSLDETGHRSAPSPVIRLATPAAPKTTLLWTIAALLFVAAGLFAALQIRKYRRQADASDADRIARLGRT